MISPPHSSIQDDAPSGRRDEFNFRMRLHRSASSESDSLPSCQHNHCPVRLPRTVKANERGRHLPLTDVVE
jgi:hypothetical protein